MKRTKRIITAILALVMIVSTMGISTFAASFSDITDERVGEAVAKLVASGIITGYEDGTFRPDNQITRAEFAAIVTRMKGVAGNLGADATTGFSDLDSDDASAWARPYVKAAVDLGIINGFEDGTFRATQPVTYEQAVKMLVCAKGYEIVAQSEYNKVKAANPNATWSAGYIAAANKHGFTKGAVTAKITEPASRGVVALLTSNTIEVAALQQNQDGSVGKGDSSTSDEEKTIVEVKGIVSGTYYTAIDAPSAGLTLNEIRIFTAENGEETYELSPSLASSVDFEDLIGKGVTAYYSTIDRQLTSITKTANTITTIDEADVIRPIENGELKYRNGKKTGSVNLSAYTIIYNGKYIPSNSDIIDDLDDEFTNGTIELIETNGRKFAKITSYDVYVVDSFNRSSGKITFKYGAGYYTFPSTTDDKPEIYVDGTKKAYDSLSLKAYSVINFREAPEVGGNCINKMYVTTKSYSGKVTAQLDKERTVELNNKEIILTNMYNDFTGSGKAPFTLGDSYKYYLDATGQLAAIDYNPLTSSDYELGYIINADDDAVNLIKKDKTIEIVPMRNKVRVDGVSMDKEEVKAKLEEIADTLFEAYECSQPVKYIITNDELTAIDTAANTAGERATTVGTSSDDTFIYNIGANVATNKSSITAGGKTYQLSSAMVIYVPEDSTNEAGYSIMTPAKAFAAGATRDVKIFGADPDERTKKASIVLINGVDPAYDFIGTTPYMIVTEVDRANEVITGFAKGSTSETSIELSEDKFKSFEDNDEFVSFDYVEEGDIIRYIEDASGVIAIEMIYEAGSEGGLLFSEGSEAYMYYRSFTEGVGDLKIRYLEAFDITGTSQLSATKAMGDSYNDAQKQAEGNLITYPINSSTTVYYVDEEDNIVVATGDEKYENISITEGSSSEIIVFTTDTTNNTARVIYIVK